MIDVIKVNYINNDDINFVSPNDLDVKYLDTVVVETDNGLQLGTVKKEIYKEKKENLALPLDKVIRVATEEDIKKFDSNVKQAKKALSDAKKYSSELGLDMSFISSCYNLDKTLLLFYFVADERVDFRELAKKLAQKYRTRIELRQIGVRDKAKAIGGLGPCGLFLCCNTFLTDFNSVSINMAKNQLLALNPSKINGVCGRLMCCLGYENDLYTELKKKLPKIGAIMDTKHGVGKVVDIDVFKGIYHVDVKDQGIFEFSQEDYNESVK